MPAGPQDIIKLLARVYSQRAWAGLQARQRAAPVGCAGWQATRQCLSCDLPALNHAAALAISAQLVHQGWLRWPQTSPARPEFLPASQRQATTSSKRR